MANTPDNLLPESWHKYFAIEANNAAWTLSESLADISLRTEVLDLAHASAWHWRVAGKEIHHMRSVMLLALVHARMFDLLLHGIGREQLILQDGAGKQHQGGKHQELPPRQLGYPGGDRVEAAMQHAGLI